MKIQVARFSPHQNGKVFGVLTAVVSLIFLIPVFLIMSMVPGEAKLPIWAILVLPIFYLVFTYIGTVIACALYNVIVPMIGGIEYDTTTPTA